MTASPAATTPKVNPTNSIPVDPIALLTLAHEKNGLSSADVRPWHIRVTYTTFDQKGNPEDHGVYEEWWFSPTKYKRTYASSKFNQTDYATGTGLYREGLQDWPDGNALLLRSALIDPLPETELLKDFTPQQFEIVSGAAKLNCARLGFPLPPNMVVPNNYFPTFCFAEAAPALRMVSQDTSQTTYNRVVLFQGHYLAKEVHLAFNNKPEFDFQVEIVEALKESPDVLLVPSKTAIAVNLAEPIKQYEGKYHLLVLKRIYPTYPQFAKDQRVQGMVVQHVTIGQNGHVVSQQVVSGPPQLRQAAVDAVRDWIYRPFEVFGKPTQVEVVIKVNFGLGSNNYEFLR